MKGESEVADAPPHPTCRKPRALGSSLCLAKGTVLLVWFKDRKKRCMSCCVHFESKAVSLMSGSSSVIPLAGG